MNKDDLKAYRAQGLRVRQLRLMLDEMDAALTGPRGQQLTGMPRGGGSGDHMADMVAKHIELRERYLRELATAEAEQLRVEKALEHLSPLERTLIRCRYVSCMDWETVCKQIGYSWRQTMRLHGRALEKLKEL